jgi:DNA-binding NtrC family response regulator
VSRPCTHWRSVPGAATCANCRTSSSTSRCGPIPDAAWRRLPSLTEPPASANPASLLSTLQEETYHRARDRVIAQFETQYFTWLINRAGGNMSQAARLAGVDRTTLYRLMERHHLQRDRGQGWSAEGGGDTTPAMRGSNATPLEVTT